MKRDHYKTPDTDVSAEFDRVCQLFQEALPEPSDRFVFECLMNEASNLGLNWVDGLRYVVEKRNRLQASEANPPSISEGGDCRSGKGEIRSSDCPDGGRPNGSKPDGKR